MFKTFENLKMHYIRRYSSPLKRIRLKTLLLMVVMTMILTFSNAQETQEFQYFLERYGWYVTQLPDEKVQLSPEQFGSVEVKPQNFEDIQFEWKEKDYQYFIIGNSDEMLVLKSLEMVRREYKTKIRKDQEK